VVLENTTCIPYIEKEISNYKVETLPRELSFMEL
jgi:hypothetical protein